LLMGAAAKSKIGIMPHTESRLCDRLWHGYADPKTETRDRGARSGGRPRAKSGEVCSTSPAKLRENQRT
jgi:hypothetical protein